MTYVRETGVGGRVSWQGGCVRKGRIREKKLRLETFSMKSLKRKFSDNRGNKKKGVGKNYKAFYEKKQER